MTVSSEVSVAGPYTGDGGTNVFGFDFKIIDADHLRVTRIGLDGVYTVLSRGAGDYTVSGVGADNGSITLPVALNENLKLTIERIVPFTQETELSNNGAYHAQTVETRMDIAVMQVQAVKEKTDRAVVSPIGEPGLTIQGGIANGQLLMKQGDKLVAGPNAADIIAAQAAAEEAVAAAISVNIKRVANIPALKALNSAVTKLAFLPDDTGFDFKSINSEAAAEFDPNENIVVQDPLVPLALGAWYRRLKGDQPGVRDAFKAKGDGSADDTAKLQDAINWMEYYPPRSRSLVWERGIYNFDQLTIPEDILGLSFVGGGSSFWDVTLECQTTGADPAIINRAQEFKMFDMSLMSSRPNTENWLALKKGLANDKDYTVDLPLKVADVDVTISRCRIAGFHQGIYHKGRGLAAHNNHFSSCHFGIGLDWPDLGTYAPSAVDGADVLDDAMGFRGIAVSNTRFHSLDYAAVANVGNNANKIVGLDINNITLDIGRRIFYGHLGTHSSISEATSTLSATEILELTGGRNFKVSGINGGGNLKGGSRTPVNLIKLTTGLFIGGRFSDMVLSNSEGHAIRDTSTKMQGVTFSDITFQDVGFDDVANARCFSFGSQNSDIEIINTKLVGTDNLNAMVGNNFSSNLIRMINPSREGNTTPWTAGSVMLIGKRQPYTPSIVTGTGTALDPYVVSGSNVALVPGSVTTDPITSPLVSALDWRYADDDWIELEGRIVASVIDAAVDGEINLELPVPSTFTQPYQANGALIATTSLQNIAGGVYASGNRLKIRWKAPTTNNNSFSFRARYRRL